MEELRPVIDEQLRQGKDVTFRIKGNSMFPFLHSGKTDVTLTSAPKGCLRNDVILFQTDGGKYIMHRIVRVEQGYYITMGDGLVSKEKAAADQVVGVMKSFSYKGKVRSVENRSYRFSVCLWNLLRPFRSIILGLHRRLFRSYYHE